MRRGWLVAWVCAGLLLAACTPSKTDTSRAATPENPALKDALPPDVALNVQNQISETLGASQQDIQITKVEKMDWPNACLGLPKADEVCAEVVTPGWLLTFNIKGQEYRYRVDETGTVIRQEP